MNASFIDPPSSGNPVIDAERMMSDFAAYTERVRRLDGDVVRRYAGSFRRIATRLRVFVSATKAAP